MSKFRAKDLIAVLTASLLVAGCAGIQPYDPPDYKEEPPGNGLLTGADGEFVIHVNTNQSKSLCPEIRPEVCTMDYNPVCGQLSDGSFKTYSNGCNACVDPKVISYSQGECR